MPTEREKMEMWHRMKKQGNPSSTDEQKITNTLNAPEPNSSNPNASFEQFKKAYTDALKETNDKLGTNVRLMGIQNNGNGTYTVTTLWTPEDMKNADKFKGLFDNNLRAKLNPQNTAVNQNQGNQQNTMQAAANTSTTPTTATPPTPSSTTPNPFKITPPNPTDIK